MESLIYTIAKELNISEFLLNIPTFYESFSNWYFNNHHNWEFIPDEPIVDQNFEDYESDSESEIEWYISADHSKNNNCEQFSDLDDLFDSSDNISDTGSDYSLHWYRSD